MHMHDIAVEWDVYQEKCPTRMVMSRIADKWVLLVLGIIERGPARFGQLRREIEGISQKSLTQTLRALERDGFVNRRVIVTSPIAVEYSITTLGRTLAQAAEAVRTWSETHIEEVLAAQQEYDAR